MEPQSRPGISVTWHPPRAADLAVAAALGYLLHLQPEVPAAIAAVVAVLALRCIRIHRTV